MIISVDHRGLEWCIATYLSQDPVAMQEIWDGVDLHAENQARFNLPARVIAKTFLFRLIFCVEETAAWSFAHDPNFNHVSKDPKYWQKVIDGFYTKYERLFIGWHKELMKEVEDTGKLVSVDGRIYNFEPYEKKGEWKLPKTKIYNYPVQGLGAFLVMLSRISLWNRVRASALKGPVYTKFVNTVHDDIWLDTSMSEIKGIDKHGNSCYNICTEIKNVFEDLPANFKRTTGKDYNLPTKFEIKLLTGEELKI